MRPASQHEFDLMDVSGTLIGIWSPGFSSAFSVPGYHFHFLTEDRRHGGHVFECTAKRLRIRMKALNDFHLALPETEAAVAAGIVLVTIAFAKFARGIPHKRNRSRSPDHIG